MGVRKPEADTVRLTVDLSREAYARLEALRELTEAPTKASVIRTALKLLDVASKLAADGYTIAAVKGNESEPLKILEGET